MSLRTPSYRLHKPSGQAVVTLGGRDFYLGKHGSLASRAEYDRLVAEWLAGGRTVAPNAGDGTADPTVAELILAYVTHADAYYVKDGGPTSEPGIIRLALKPLRRLYGHTPARDFGPLALKAVRDAMIAGDLCRNEVNRRARIIVRAFKWGVENEMVPPSVHHGLKAVSGLRKGRSEVRESEPVRPVPEAFVGAVRPLVSRQVRAMIDLQMLTAMRPGEVTRLRTCDLDTAGRIWIFIPHRHKTQHHGRERTIYFGPRAQAILREWLRPDLEGYLFQPREAEARRKAEMRRKRKTKVQPSQRDRSRAKPRKAPGERYDATSYRKAVRLACLKAAVPVWHPSQLRHNAATWLRKEFGIEVARIILGHTSASTTCIYAEQDREKALAVMERVG